MSHWRRSLSERGFELRDPAHPDDVAAAERELDVRLPDDVHALLLETDGVFSRHGEAIVAPCAGIVSATREMWTLDSERIYMRFHPHVFFADEADGDRYFFRVLGDAPDFDIFAWDHEDDSRTHVAWHLERYLTARQEGA